MDEITLDFTRIKKRQQLTPEQQEIVDTPGNVFCIACPGAGKTEVLTQRAERIMNAGGKPLCLVFTRHAREEIESRIPGIEARTLHSFSHKYVGWKDSYDDLLVRFKEKQNKEAYTSVLVDEAQDITPLEWQIIKSIPKEELFIVGDPYQSIYIGDWVNTKRNWLPVGVDLEYISKVLFPDIKSLPLRENWRSARRVTDLLERIYPRNLIPKGPKDLDTIGVFARSNQRLEELSVILKSKNIAHNIRIGSDEGTPRTETYGDYPKINLTVLHANKGKQFSKVLVFDWERGKNFTEDKNLLYVALARASQEAWIIDDGFLRKSTARLFDFRDITINRYYFTDLVKPTT